MAAVRKKPAFGAWIALDEAGRWEWLRQAHGRHFGRRRWRQSPIGTTFDLPGEQIVDLSSFFCAIGEAVNGPGGYFGQNMLGFDDCCVGRFGLTPPSVILWRDAAISRRHLDHAALHRWAQATAVEDDSSIDAQGLAWIQQTLAASSRAEGPTLYDMLVATFEERGVQVVEASP